MSSAEPTPVIRVHAASFGYSERTVVTDVDLVVERGEVVAVLGPNGSGKSTVVKGLLGLAETSRGTVDLFGTPREHLEDRTRVGYVPQRHTLASTVSATVEEIVATGRVPRVPWWAPWRALAPEHRTAVREAIEVVGLGEQRTHEVSTLSGGQQRRVLIARALAAGPELFILDEPTAGVDVGNQRVLAAVLRRLVERGATLVVVTHELDALRDLVSRAVVVRDGAIAYDGPPSALDDLGHVHHHHDDELDHEPDPSLTGEIIAPRRRA